MRPSQRIFAILGIGAALIASELLVLRSLNTSMGKLANGFGVVLQRADSLLTIVSVSSKLLTVSNSGRFHGLPSDAEKPRPRFDDYPAKNIYRGEPARPIITKEFRSVRTTIRKGADSDVEFAGHYTI